VSDKTRFLSNAKVKGELADRISVSPLYQQNGKLLRKSTLRKIQRKKFPQIRSKPLIGSRHASFCPRRDIKSIHCPNFTDSVASSIDLRSQPTVSLGLILLISFSPDLIKYPIPTPTYKFIYGTISFNHGDLRRSRCAERAPATPPRRHTNCPQCGSQGPLHQILHPLPNSAPSPN